MNVKRGLNNIFYGILSQIITMGISIIVPRLVLVNLGSEANGLLHSISTVFTYLTLLEAGVGKATQQALYRPLGTDNKQEINRIMSATNKFYRRTGWIYAGAVLAFAVGYTLWVKTSLPAYVVFSVILLSGASSVMSYFVQGKYKVLMETEGRSYVLVNISTISSICTSICKILLLVYGFGLVAIQEMYLFFAVLQMLAIVYYVHVNYKWLDLKCEPDYEAISQKNSVLVHQITGMVFNNTDILLLTAMTNLKVVSVYSLYNTFYGILKNVLNTIANSFMYVMGNTFHTDRKKFDQLHSVYEVYYMTLTFAFMCILQLFIIPFIRIYTSGVTDIQYADPYIPMLFTIVYLLSNGRMSSAMLIELSEHFKQTRGRSILEAVINLTVSVISIHYIGIYGALLGTIVALLYRANDMILYANRLVGRSPWITYRRWLVNLVTFVIVSLLSNRILPPMYNLLEVIGYGILACLIIVPVFLLVSSVFEIQTAKFTVGLVKQLVRQRQGGKID